MNTLKGEAINFEEFATGYPELLPGDEVNGRYTVQDHIATSKMATVFGAFDEDKKPVVLKVPINNSAESLQWFISEAEVTEVVSERIDRTLSFVEAGDFTIGDARFMFMALKRVSGRTLSDLSLEYTRGVPLKELLPVIIPATQALSQAHDLGIIHRDIKPEHIHIDEQNRGNLGDWGIAAIKKSIDEARSLPVQLSDNVLTQETQPYGFIGTPQYAAPELVTNNRRFSEASDVFSLSAATYNALTGKLHVEPALNHYGLQKMAREFEPPAADAYPGHLPTDLIELNRAGMSQPEDRPTTREIVAAYREYTDA